MAPKYAILNYDDAYFNLWNEMACNSKVISFGTNSDVTLTHVHDTGLTLSSTGNNDTAAFIRTDHDIELDLLQIKNKLETVNQRVETSLNSEKDLKLQ